MRSISISVSVPATVTACFVDHFICVLPPPPSYVYGTCFALFGSWKILTQTNNHPQNYTQSLVAENSQFVAGEERMIDFTYIWHTLLPAQHPNMHVSLYHKHSYHNVIKQHLHISKCDCCCVCNVHVCICVTKLSDTAEHFHHCIFIWLMQSQTKGVRLRNLKLNEHWECRAHNPLTDASAFSCKEKMVQ